MLLDGQVLATLIALDSKFIVTSASGYLLTMTISLVASIGYLSNVKFYVFQ
jgi:hypothetical protein